MAFSLNNNLITTGLKNLLGFVYNYLVNVPRFNNPVGRRLASHDHLYLDEGTITIESSEFMAIQFRDYFALKLMEFVNKALDKAVVLPLRIHRKLLQIFEIVIHTYTSMLIIPVTITITLLKYVAFMFNFAESQILKLEPKRIISTETESNGSRVFQLKEYMKCKSEKVNKALVELVPEKESSQTVCDAMGHSLLAGGKRIRPMLCIASCELVGGDESSVMPMACAMEIIHTASLIIDDLPCMDDDDLRRGRPSNHKMFGVSVAILASAALCCLAFENILANTENVSQDRVVQAIYELVSAVGLDGLVSGQFLDLDCEGKQVTLEELKNIHVLKTGRLLEASVVCGAIIGGASTIELKRLRKYANCIGLLFQVVDDILDETQTAEILGKTTGKDLASDKATFPKLMGINSAKNYARELVDQAVQELAHFDTARAAPLNDLAYYILNRES